MHSNRTRLSSHGGFVIQSRLNPCVTSCLLTSISWPFTKRHYGGACPWLSDWRPVFSAWKHRQLTAAVKTQYSGGSCRRGVKCCRYLGSLTHIIDLFWSQQWWQTCPSAYYECSLCSVFSIQRCSDAYSYSIVFMLFCETA